MSFGSVVVWLVMAVLFLVIELITVGMVSIWFMIGALAAALTAGLHGPIWLQIVVFLVVSGVSFAALYPRVRHMVTKRNQPTNADMVIGQTCVVTRRIDNLAGTGAVSIGGKTWTARTEDGSVVDPDALVTAVRIEGVKLIVSPFSQAEPSQNE